MVDTRAAIERSSDLWTPAQLGSDLALWLDFWDSDFQLRTDGSTDYVEEWGDLSGNGNDATQGTGSEQPIKDGDGVDFSTSGVHLDGGVSSGGSDILLWALVNVDLLEKRQGFIDLHDGTNTNTGALIFVGGDRVKYRVQANNHLTVTGGKISGSPRILILRYTSDGLEGRIDGKTDGSLSYDGDVNTNQDFQIGSLKGLEERFEQYGDSWGYGYVEDAATLENVELVEGHLAHKADRNGIPEPLQNLPSDHPYKSEPPRA